VEYTEYNVLSSDEDTIEWKADLEMKLLRWRRNVLLLEDWGSIDDGRERSLYIYDYDKSQRQIKDLMNFMLADCSTTWNLLISSKP
jgi:hypothetical protein